MSVALSLLLAVTTVAQTPPPAQAPAPRARARAVTPVTTIAPTALLTPAMTLEAAAQALAYVDANLQAMTLQAPVAALAGAGAQLEAVAFGLSGVPAIAMWEDAEPELLEEVALDFPQDPADSLYRAARRALSNNQYQRAAELFRSVRDRYPRSDYVANTYYWEAFALYRSGSDDALRAARTALKAQKDKFPRATTRRDAEVLLRRVQGTLAQRGDAEAAAAINQDLDDIEPVTPVTPGAPVSPVTPAVPPTSGDAPRPGRRGRSESCDDEDDIRVAALNAMIGMDAERAMPTLKAILARRDSGSTCLRRKAVWLVSQKRTSETAAILLNAVRTDPDAEVREQAIFWLSQVPGDETVAALDSVLRASNDVNIQEKAIFAISQHRTSRAGEILRAYAERREAPIEMRQKAIFWLGQQRSAENAQYLRALYARLESGDLKENVLFSLSQMGGADNYRWLMDIALSQNEDIEIRKKALFWAGQGRSVDIADLVRLYDSMKDTEMREQLIFVYSQRREPAALDKLFAIGRSDPDRELRKKAIFWIGQSRDPRAAQFLQELINQ